MHGCLLFPNSWLLGRMGPWLEPLCHRVVSGIHCGWRSKRLGSDSDPNQLSDLQQFPHIFRIFSSIKGGVNTEWLLDSFNPGYSIFHDYFEHGHGLPHGTSVLLKCYAWLHRTHPGLIPYFCFVESFSVTCVVEFQIDMCIFITSMANLISPAEYKQI